MTLYAYNSTIIQFSIIGQLSTDAQVVVGSQALLATTNVGVSGYAFYLDGSNASFLINGTVAGGLGAIGSSHLSPNLDIHVGTSGVLDGWETLFLEGANPHIFNEGLISGRSIAIHLGGVFSSGLGHISVVNYGTISGGAYSIAVIDGSTQDTVVDNHGVIGGDVADVAFGAGDATLTDDIVRNAGQIYGRVYLGGGNDLFDARYGEVHGTIYCGPGDDRYIPGAGDETVYGEGGTGDTVDFRFAAGVTVALDGTLDATGPALGDVYNDFENVFGSAGDDIIRGSSSANKLYGNGGADSLDGADGSDTLYGGRGNDTLTGGLGADVFVFDSPLKPATNRDTITDFNVADDTIALKHGVFAGLGAAIGVLDASMFKNLTTGGAVDATDRILYNDTTGALYYDSDGSGAAAAVQFATITGAPTLFNTDFSVI